MSESVKATAASHPVAARQNLYRAAIVGAASLKGKEIAEMLNERNFPAVDVRLLDDDEALGQLEAMGDEISFIQSVRAEQFEHVDFTFFASDEECTRSNWKRARDAGSAIIDLSGVLEKEAGSSVRSLWVERERGQVAPPELQPGPCVAAHPVAVTVALLLLRASKAGAIRRVAATIFEPASEHGQRGMDELHQQTVNLLSFQPLPKDVFDAQIAFNMVARYGQKSQPSLDSVEAKILRHYLKIAEKGAPQPSVMLLQAPIFHGHALAIFLEMDSAVDVPTMSKALAGDHVKVPEADEDAPSNVSSAGQGDILLSLKSDPVQPNGVWMWAAADNLRISALTAVECAESMAATRPTGKIQ
ncbi:MAG TPA: Asd/ArgC dimerization domain-containing protein [Candidatus Sulfotelmatobacter sp.]|jgi:aspartate-semialdehyde dehydrogenase|nr:Asd/ArgC dimerization domain-containing protein [Candidatus Sulfotelmatobacter sp.]